MKDFCLLNDCYFSIVFCLIFKLPATYFWAFLIMSFLNLKSFQKNSYSTAVSWHFCLSTCLQSPSIMEDFCLLNDCYFSVIFCLIFKFPATYLLLNFLNYEFPQSQVFSKERPFKCCFLTFLPFNSLTVTLDYGRFLLIEWLLFFSYVLLNLQDFNNLLTLEFPQKNFISVNYRVGCLPFDISARQLAYSYPQLMEDFCLLDDCYFSAIICLIFKFPATYLLLSFLNYEFPQSQVFSKELLFNCCFLTFLPLNSLTVTLDYGRFLFIE